MAVSLASSFEPRAVCYRCLRPARVCYCDRIPRIETATRVLFLQHPREEFMPIGTARMASLSLPRSELVVGTEVEHVRAVREALDDPDRTPVLLWPGEGARDLRDAPRDRPLTLVVVDGTWSLAKKLVRLNPRVANLPRYHLGEGAPSRYRIRAEPRADFVSTVEAVMRALAILEGDEQRFLPMLDPFFAMIDTQVEHERVLQGARLRYAYKKRKPRPVPARLIDGTEIVVIAGEANAWPRKPTPPHPDELVQLVAHRLSDGSTFEAIIAPEHPLAPATPGFTELDARVIAAGASYASFAARWAAFLREGDAIAAWGHYAAGLLRERGAALPTAFVDLRGAAAQWLRDKTGPLEAFSERTGLSGPPLGAGRAGRRLGMAVRVAQLLRAGATTA